QGRNSSGDRGEAVEALHAIKEIALGVRRELLAGDVSRIGQCLHESWLAKRTLAAGVSHELIDRWYEAALAAGAEGGKIVGAGGGGFLLLYCEPERQDQVTEALHACGLTRM